ncbi:GAF domain-containing protein, partial [Roseinatronobacter thiooxidans]
MTAPEHLLSALAERERQLRQERISASHGRTLMMAMDVLHASEVPEQGIAQVLEIVRSATGADLAVLLCHEDRGEVATRLATDPAFGQPHWCIDAGFLARKRRITDISEAGLASGLPPQAGGFQSLLSVPLAVTDEAPMVIVLLSSAAAKFSRFDEDLLQRIVTLLEQAIDRLRLIHRNAVLAQIVDTEVSAPAASYFAESSFDVLSRAFAHVVDWQRNIVDIT